MDAHARHRLGGTLVFLTLSLMACEEVEPRCDELCTTRMPNADGAFYVCNQESADLCKRVCLARIKGQGGICQSCLVAGAQFAPDHAQLYTETCNGTQCKVTADQRICTYYSDQNPKGRDDCLATLFPRKSVDCRTRFFPVSECLPICNDVPPPSMDVPASPVDLSSAGDLSAPPSPSDMGTPNGLVMRNAERGVPRPTAGSLDGAAALARRSTSAPPH